MKKAKFMLSAILVLGVVGGILAYKQVRSADALWCKFSTGVRCRLYEDVTTQNTGTPVTCPSTAVTSLYYLNSSCTGIPVQGYFTAN